MAARPSCGEDQPLDKAGEEARPEGKRSVRYSATRYEGTDAARYGIKVRVRTRSGAQVSTEPCGVVRDPNEPDPSTR